MSAQQDNSPDAGAFLMTPEMLKSVVQEISGTVVTQCWTLLEPHLDNGTLSSQNYMPCSEGNHDMARKKIKIDLGDGTIRWKTGDSLQEIVDALIPELKRVWGNPAQPTDAKHVFRQYAENWLTLFKEHKLKETTLRTYRNLLDKHIYPFFGEMPIEKITTNDIQSFYNLCGDMAHSSVRQMKIILSQVFTSAMEDGFLSADPTKSKRLSMPTKVNARSALSASHYRDIIAHLHCLNLNDKLMLGLLLYTGMRRGEMLGLMWNDIDFDQNILHIARNVTFRSNQPVVGTPKSKAGFREIPLCRVLKELLHGNQSGAFVVGNGDIPLTESTFDRAWQRIGKTIDLHGATPHILRHTYLTELAAAKVDVKTIQAIAGHADIRMTMDRYVDKRTEKIQQAGETFNAAMVAWVPLDGTTVEHVG